MATLDEYCDNLAKSMPESAVLWHLYNIKSAYYHEHGRYPSKDEFISFADSKLGTNSRQACILTEKKSVENLQREYSPFNKKYKIWK